jgi:succinate-semialdehyde dehydrogenase/glutarate-semialdehyde dehydrogenase
LQKAAQVGCISRCINNGQACINAKRFIVHESVYDEFKEKLIEQFSNQKVGDPLEPETTIGPLARDDLYSNLRNQVLSAIEHGASVAFGDVTKLGNVTEDEGYFFHPMLLENITRENPVYKEELFGPVSCLYKVKNDQEAIDLGKLYM